MTRKYAVHNIPEGENAEGCPAYGFGAELSFTTSPYSDYKVMLDFPDVINDQSGYSYYGVLKLIDGTSNFFSVYVGDEDVLGNLLPTKEYVYTQIENQ